MLTFLAAVAGIAALLGLSAAWLVEVFPGPTVAAWRLVRRGHRHPPPARRTGSSIEARHAGGPVLTGGGARSDGPPLPGDTCDRCATSAAVAVYVTHGQLLLCGHHGRQLQHVLHAQGAMIVGQLDFPPGLSGDGRAVHRL